MRYPVEVLDHGYIRFVEAWGHGDAGTLIDRDESGAFDYECGIVEAARQSTQASFRGWEDKTCPECGGSGTYLQAAPDRGPAPKCEKCEGKGYLSGDKRLLAYLFNGKPQHATPFEFSGMVIEVQAPIFVFREWHRHRTQSYNEMSARYAPLPDLNYIPTEERVLRNSKTNKQAGTVKGAEELTTEGAEEFRNELETMYRAQETFYQKWLGRGVPKELARIDLPVGRYSRMRASTNLRNWLAFCTLRSDPMAQWEIQQFSKAVEGIIEKVFPRTYSLFLKRRDGG